MGAERPDVLISIKSKYSTKKVTKIMKVIYFQKRKKGRKKKFRNNKNYKLQNFLMKGHF